MAWGEERKEEENKPSELKEHPGSLRLPTSLSWSVYGLSPVIIKNKNEKAKHAL